MASAASRIGLGEELRAEYSRWIYWFTDSGILRIQTVSFAPLLGAAVGFGALLVVVILFLADTLTGFSSEILLVAFVLGLGVIMALPLLIPEIIRNRLLTKPLEELTRRSGSIQIPWEEVQKAKSGRGVITIWTSTGRYVVFARMNQKVIEDFM